MAENCLKIQIRRFLRSPLSSCKSKDQISDVVETHHNRQRYQLVELFSPHPHPFTFSPTPDETYFNSKFPFLSPDVNGRNCPPASPIISPLNNFYQVPKQKKNPQTKKKGRFTACKSYSGFEDQFPECKYNGLFSSDDEDGGRHSSASASWRRTEAVEESLAVVKRSSDPYSDFRTSMVEMIVEKQIFAARDLENLLKCFLSLNSYHHHKIIIQVFAEIWEALPL